MGAPRQFPLEYEEVVEAIRQYKEDLATGVIDRADFWDFCGRIGVSDDEVIEVVNNPNQKNEKLANELKRYVTWQKGQYASGPGWGGPNASKAIFLLKQKLGGYQLTDKQEVGISGKAEVEVKFSGPKGAFD